MIQFILIVQLAPGVLAAAKDCFYKFSNLGDAGNYILLHRYDTLAFAGMPDYMVSPITTFDQPLTDSYTKSLQIGDSSEIFLVSRFDKSCMIGDEKYYVYEARLKKNNLRF